METKAYHKANLLDMSLLRNVLQEGELAKQVWERFLGFPVRSIDSIKKRVTCSRFPIFNGYRCKYTFKKICQENNSVEYNDGIVKILLSTKGAMKNIPKELQKILKYLEGKEADDALVRKIDMLISTLKEEESMK